MIADHVERFFREMIFHDLIKVFVVAPGEMDLIEAAALLVNSKAGLELRIFGVGIIAEIRVENNFLGVLASDRESIADDRPLRFAEEAKDFSEVMN